MRNMEAGYYLIRFSFFLTIAVLFSCVDELSIGANDVYAQPSTQSTQPSDDQTQAGKIDRYYQRTDQILLSSAEWIDSFFGTETYGEEENRTYFRIRLTGFMEEGEGLEGNARFKLKLKLPGTEKRLRLVIGSDPDVSDALDDSPVDTIRDRPEDVEDDTTIGLQYFFRDLDNHKLKFSGGIRIRSGTLVPYGSSRYRYIKKYERWSMGFTERLRWYSDDGWDSRTRIDFDRPITDDLFFRTTPGLDWFQDRDGLYYSLTTSLFHLLNQNMALQYEFNNYFHTELSGHLQEINLRVRYRQRIWREWLILEAAPQLAWYEERDFETVPGVFIRLEIWLGRFPKPELAQY